MENCDQLNKVGEAVSHNRGTISEDFLTEAIEYDNVHHDVIVKECLHSGVVMQEMQTEVEECGNTNTGDEDPEGDESIHPAVSVVTAEGQFDDVKELGSPTPEKARVSYSEDTFEELGFYDIIEYEVEEEEGLKSKYFQEDQTRSSLSRLILLEDRLEHYEGNAGSKSESLLENGNSFSPSEDSYVNESLQTSASCGDIDEETRETSELTENCCESNDDGIIVTDLLEGSDLIGGISNMV